MTYNEREREFMFTKNETLKPETETHLHFYFMFLPCYCMRKMSVRQTVGCEKTKVLEHFMLRLYFVCFYNVPANKTHVINVLLGLLCAFMTIS